MAGLHNPDLELIDPTPDVWALFAQFNTQFFEGRLGVVTVEWSKRMTTCAGLCYYQGRVGGCRIKLSEPLLALRPRTDLIDTLIHEMIHAYLFITGGYSKLDRDGHGKDFQDLMRTINAAAGTRITIYHTFHDEVEHHRKHWWQCSGPCSTRPPYFGLVKRAMNRAPGPNDTWWADHQASCSGSFTKIKEPPPKVKPVKVKEGGGGRKRRRHSGGSGSGSSNQNKKAATTTTPITNFFQKTDDSSSSSTSSGGSNNGINGDSKATSTVTSSSSSTSAATSSASVTTPPKTSASSAAGKGGHDDVINLESSDDEEEDKDLKMAIALSLQSQSQSSSNNKSDNINKDKKKVAIPAPPKIAPPIPRPPPTATTTSSSSADNDDRFPGKGYRLGG